MKIDGVAEAAATYSGDTKPDANTTIDRIYFLAGNNTKFYVDDLAVNNISESVEKQVRN